MNRTFEAGRWVAELRPSGPARWIVAGFLSFWLAGWAMGEVAGLGLLLGSTGVLTELPRWMPRVGHASSPPVLVFALVWVGFWSLGGLFAGTQVLRMLWGRDRIEYDGAGVKVSRAIGPMGRSRSFAREEIRAVGLRRNQLVLETSRGIAALTRFGSGNERVELKADLERTLALGYETEGPAELPSGWVSDLDPQGLTVLRRAAGLRVSRAVLVGAVFIALAFALAIATRATARGRDPLAWIPTVFLSLFVVVAGAGAAWLALGREELILGHGRAERRRRFGARMWTKRFVPASLELKHSVDSDGDDPYQLVLRGADGAHTVDSVFHEPSDLMRLGRWMAARLGCELRLPAHLRPKSDAA